MKIVGATILPRGGEPAWTGVMETVRVAVNNWIRRGASFDGVVDFDNLMSVAGPAGIPVINPLWSCGDHDGVHPNAAGYAAMGASVDLTLFRGSNDR